MLYFNSVSFKDFFCPVKFSRNSVDNYLSIYFFNWNAFILKVSVRSSDLTLQGVPSLPAGVSQISFWPGDPEISMLESAPRPATEEAALDAVATEKLKSNSRPHVCVLLQPPTPDMLQFVNETSRDCDFRERRSEDAEDFNRSDPQSEERLRKDGSWSGSALPQRTRQILEGFLQKVPGVYSPAAQADPDPNGPGELLRRAVLLQPEAQHEGAGGGSGRRGRRRPAAPPRLPQVGDAEHLEGWAFLLVTVCFLPENTRGRHQVRMRRYLSRWHATASSRPGCWPTGRVRRRSSAGETAKTPTNDGHQ